MYEYWQTKTESALYLKLGFASALRRTLRYYRLRALFLTLGATILLAVVAIYRELL